MSPVEDAAAVGDISRRAIHIKWRGNFEFDACDRGASFHDFFHHHRSKPSLRPENIRCLAHELPLCSVAVEKAGRYEVEK